VNERGLAAADRVVRLLGQLGIERVHVVQGVAEAAAHPERVASLALVTPAASASPAASARRVAEAGDAATDHP
jgi:hypothetical protein